MLLASIWRIAAGLISIVTGGLSSSDASSEFPEPRNKASNFPASQWFPPPTAYRHHHISPGAFCRPVRRRQFHQRQCIECRRRPRARLYSGTTPPSLQWRCRFAIRERPDFRGRLRCRSSLAAPSRGCRSRQTVTLPVSAPKSQEGHRFPVHNECHDQPGGA